jgi:hypothetical protein
MKFIVFISTLLFVFLCNAQNNNLGYVVSSNYDEIGESNGMSLLIKDGKIGAATTNGKILFPCIYSFAYYFPKSKTFLVNVGGNFNLYSPDNTSVGGKWGIINEKGNVITEIKYTRLFPFEEFDYQVVNVGGLIKGEKIEDEIDGGKWGLLHKSGKEVIPCIYDYIAWIYEDAVCVNMGGTQHLDGNFQGGIWGMIDKNGNSLTSIKYTHLYSFDNEEYQLVNENGKYINGEIQGGKWGLLHKSGKEVIPCAYDNIYSLDESLYAVNIEALYSDNVRSEGKWGIINNQGKILTSIKYNKITSFNEAGFQIVSEGGDANLKGSKWGVLNKDGKEIIQCKYDYIEDALENIFKVKINNKWGYCDILGNVVVPIEYDEIGTFYDGVARVTKDGQLTLLKNPLKEGNAITLAQASSSAKKDPNAPAVSRYPAPNSDVDKDIPQSKTKSENTFAFIIANENYPDAPVPFALNDGRIFKEYCQKMLGLPEKNIKMFEDASLGRIIAAVEQIKSIANAYEGEAEAIIYYAGHGVPDEKKNTAFLLPVDGSSSDITTTGYSLEKFYTELSKLNLKTVTVFLDACFSGAKREDEMLASARGIAVKVKDEAPKGNMVVFSAATGDETAHQYEEKGHGLFTYFLLKKLQETQGAATYGELSDYVVKQVKRHSVVINNKRQTPTVIPSASLTNWQGLKLK